MCLSVAVYLSRTRARVVREARACAARTAVKELCAAPCVRVCVVCFATRVGAVGATLALPLLARRDFVYSRGARDVHTHGTRV